MDVGSGQLQSKKERRAEKREQKLRGRSHNAFIETLKKYSKTISVVVIVAGALGGGAWYIMSRPSVTGAGDVIARAGIHWHPELHIFIKGAEQDIPADIGLRGVENPIHTHETDHIIHLEYTGLVRKDDLKLGNFFRIWGKQFTSSCIFDSCNGPDGKVAMTVNGNPNTEFENYLMQDKDKIEIRFE